MSLSLSLPPPSLSPCLSSSLCLLSAGEVLFQMAEVHRQIQIQLEEMVSMWCCCCQNRLLSSHKQIVEYILIFTTQRGRFFAPSERLPFSEASSFI